MRFKQNLRNKVIVVTGASSGLGEQICYEAAKKGAIVVACARRSYLLKEVQKKCEELSGNNAFSFSVDIGDQKSIDTFVGDLQVQVGKVDVLVNNAGFGLFETFVTTEFSIAKKMFEVNVLGLMYLSQKIAIQMAEQKRGHIINVASMAGKIATAKSTIYSATKFAVIGFSNALRLELKPLGIFVTTVNPGPIRTDFFDQADPAGEYLEAIGLLVLEPDKLAIEIVEAMGTAKREINRPRLMEVAARFYPLFPSLGDAIAGGILNKK